jgi:hypothetical protein
MNERLTELYRSCRPKEALASQDQYKSANVLLGSEVEKFAELIIQECMACSTWVGKMNTNLVEPIHTAHAINQRIKQQFRVEE